MITTVLLLAILTITLVNFFLAGNHQKWWRKIKHFLLIRGREITASEYEEFISQLAISIQWLCKNYVGALIVVENQNNLQKYIQLGYCVNAKFTPEFLINIFNNKSSAFHDGGIIVRGLDIISVSSYFPITTNNMNASFGARHRAGLGITEHTDAVAIVVSETNGKLSISRSGQLEEISTHDLSFLTTALAEIFAFYLK